jgi:hypothetical protein
MQAAVKDDKRETFGRFAREIERAMRERRHAQVGNRLPG